MRGATATRTAQAIPSLCPVPTVSAAIQGQEGDPFASTLASTASRARPPSVSGLATAYPAATGTACRERGRQASAARPIYGGPAPAHRWAATRSSAPFETNGRCPYRRSFRAVTGRSCAPATGASSTDAYLAYRHPFTASARPGGPADISDRSGGDRPDSAHQPRPRSVLKNQAAGCQTAQEGGPSAASFIDPPRNTRDGRLTTTSGPTRSRNGASGAPSSTRHGRHGPDGRSRPFSRTRRRTPAPDVNPIRGSFTTAVATTSRQNSVGDLGRPVPEVFSTARTSSNGRARASPGGATRFTAPVASRALPHGRPHNGGIYAAPAVARRCRGAPQVVRTTNGTGVYAGGADHRDRGRRDKALRLGFFGRNRADNGNE